MPEVCIIIFVMLGFLIQKVCEGPCEALHRLSEPAGAKIINASERLNEYDKRQIALSLCAATTHLFTHDEMLDQHTLTSGCQRPVRCYMFAGSLV